MFKKETDVLSRRILSTDWTSEREKKDRLAEKLNKMRVKFGGSKLLAPKSYLNEVK